MILLKLAYKNLIGKGLRTWLNIGVLSFIYVLIIWHQGIFSGMLRYGMREMIKDDIAGGQYWYKLYDPYDPISIEHSHGPIPSELNSLINDNQAVPILISPASIYPQGRLQTILLKGIDPDQTVLDIPANKLSRVEDILPVLIGKRMAKNNSLKIGDYVTIRFRDTNGTFDAIESKIVEIMNTKVSTIDNNQFWIPLKSLQKMTGLTNQAIHQDIKEQTEISDWLFKSSDFLLKDLKFMVKTKRIGGIVMYSILMFLAMLAVFDTQVLAIFRRRKEIGTLMALGMTRFRVIMLFTLEGILNGITAVGVAAVYGIPWLLYFSKKGMKMPVTADDFGFALAERLFPIYSAGLVLTTVLIVMCAVTIVSYIPSRKISKLNPTDSLKGKM
ncbi:ABC transporter permease [bacterium]